MRQRCDEQDESKRSAFRDLSPEAGSEALLEMQRKQKAALAAKWGAPVPGTGDLPGLAAAIEAARQYLLG